MFNVLIPEMSDQNIAIRLKFLISDLGVTNTEFADKCGISRATLSQLLTGRNQKVSDVIIGKIHAGCPNLSILWLLFGEGDMWADAAAKKTDDHSDSVPSEPSSTVSNGISGSFDWDVQPFPRENPSENLKSPSDVRQEVTERKETPLIYESERIKELEEKCVNERLKNADLEMQINILKSKFRKISRITVYYDDSTFESFVPE